MSNKIWTIKLAQFYLRGFNHTLWQRKLPECDQNVAKHILPIIMIVVIDSNMMLKETEWTVVASPVVDSSVAGRHMRHNVSSRQNSRTVRGVWEGTIPA